MIRDLANARRRRAGQRRLDQRLALRLVLPAALLILTFEIYPIALAAFDGFFHVDPYSFARRFVGLANFRRVLTDVEVQASFARSVVFTAVTVALQIALGLAVAMLLNAGLRGQTVARGLVLFPFMVPAVVAALVFRFMFSPVYGALNYVLLSSGILHQPVSFLDSPGTVLWTLIGVQTWKFTPFMVVMLLARLQTVPRDLREAAAIDGAGPTRILLHVTLPWLAPVLLVGAFLRTIWTATTYDLPYLLAQGGPLHASTTAPIEIRTLAFDRQDIGAASALAVCIGAVLIVLSAGYLRAYRRSATQIE